jgi:hypothetical protein
VGLDEGDADAEGWLMARYRAIHVKMYADEKFRALSKPKPNAQTLWVFLLTAPHTSSIPGLSTIGEAALAESLGWELEGFREAFAEVSSKAMAKADWKARVVWIPNAVKYNPPESPNVVRAWAKAWEEIPECDLKTEALSVLKAFMEGMGEGFRKAFEKGFGIAFAKPCLNQNQNQNQNQDLILSSAATNSRSTSHEIGSANDPLASAKTAAVDAMQAWSAIKPPVGRGYELCAEKNEHRKVFEMVEVIAQRAERVIRGTDAIAQHLLIPQVIEMLKQKCTGFRGVDYACTCVKGSLEQWARDGEPAQRQTSNGVSHANGANQRRAEQQKREYAPQSANPPNVLNRRTG